MGGAIGGLGRAATGMLRVLPALGVAVTAVSLGIGAYNSWKEEMDERGRRAQIGSVKYMEDERRMLRYMSQDADSAELWERHREQYEKHGITKEAFLQRQGGSGFTQAYKDAMQIVPNTFEKAFDAAALSGGYLVHNDEFIAFANAYKEHGKKMWENPLLSNQFSELLAILQNDKPSQQLIIKMTQEENNGIIKNKEFEIKAGTADRARVTTIRGENIRSFARNV
jgi:hypothetical protein